MGASEITEDISEYDTQCTRIGGTCLNWDYYLCTAGWETGLCSGASNIRCCKPCDRSCQNLENSYNDKACSDKGGKCQHNSNKCSSGSYQGGLCGGPSARQCCGASGGGGGSGSLQLGHLQFNANQGIQWTY